MTADCEGGRDEGSQRRKRQGWMNGSAEADGGRTQKGCGDSCQEKEREDGEKRDRLDGEEKKGAKRLGDIRETAWQSDVAQ